MYNGNRRPLSTKKTVQLLVILTIYAWATQTLLHQWGLGAPPPQEPARQQRGDADEKFVPGSARFVAGATLELRSEATVVGAEVKLKQVCRWSDSDASVFAPIADTVLTRLSGTTPYRTLTAGEVKATLRDAGVNLAAINFVGVTSCTVNRSDIEISETDALKKWIDAQQAKTDGEPKSDPIVASADNVAPTTQPTALASAPTTEPVEKKPFHSLRELITQDLSTRLGIPAEQLQITFRPQDERTLNLAEPLFKFQLDAARARDLGEVSWNVTLFTDSGGTQRTVISATARAWQNQLVVAKPMSSKQIIRAEDVIERRALIDRLNDDTVLDRSQSIGQQAARDLKPGQVLTARLVDAVQLVRSGQFVTITYRQGSVELKTVARALEGGSFGQTIRVKNEATRDIFEVILTGAQTASMTTPAGMGVAAAARQ